MIGMQGPHTSTHNSHGRGGGGGGGPQTKQKLPKKQFAGKHSTF
jgi:hypothetical protein